MGCRLHPICVLYLFKEIAPRIAAGLQYDAHIAMREADDAGRVFVFYIEGADAEALKNGVGGGAAFNNYKS